MIFRTLEKLKSAFLISVISLIGAVFFWSVLNISECSRQAERILRDVPVGIPLKINSEIPDTPFTLRRNLANSLVALLSSRRTGNNPVSPAYRACALPSSSIVEIAGIYIPEYLFNGERFVFQNYLRRSIPQRAGPAVS